MKLANLSKILKCAGNDDAITMKSEDNGDTITFMFESPSASRARWPLLLAWCLACCLACCLAPARAQPWGGMPALAQPLRTALAGALPP